MGRQREFDRDAVLHRAMNHFWEHGYEAASMRDLLGAMQIGRQSLYDTFGDKHSLFLAALEHYAERGVRSMLVPLAAPDGGLAAIEAYFRIAARHLCAEPHRACLVVNSTVELAPHDPEVAAITDRFIAQLQGAFRQALQVAVDKGEAQVDDLDATAWRLTNGGMGLAALSKAGTPGEKLELIATDILESLRA